MIYNLYYTILYLIIILLYYPLLWFVNFDTIKNNIISIILTDEYIIKNNIKIKYEYRKKRFSKILYKIFIKNKFPNDIYGIRIIYENPMNPNDTDTAYYIQKLLKSKYETVDYLYNDYIQNTKSNNYQCLHVYIMYKVLMEIQIQNTVMDYNNKVGKAINYF